MTLSLERLARTIARARHGTDAYWANYMGAAEAARREVVEACIATATSWRGTAEKLDQQESVSMADDIIEAMGALLARRLAAQEDSAFDGSLEDFLDSRRAR